jgi:hypothetical protein
VISFMERLALWGMALGVGAMLQPWWAHGMRIGFFVTAASTIAQIAISHVPKREHPAP